MRKQYKEKEAYHDQQSETGDRSGHPGDRRDPQRYPSACGDRFSGIPHVEDHQRILKGTGPGQHTGMRRDRRHRDAQRRKTGQAVNAAGGHRRAAHGGEERRTVCIGKQDGGSLLRSRCAYCDPAGRCQSSGEAPGRNPRQCRLPVPAQRGGCRRTDHDRQRCGGDGGSPGCDLRQPQQPGPAARPVRRRSRACDGFQLLL